MRKLVLVESRQDKKSIKLHNNILDILFSHKRDISRKLSDIKGLYFIDHVAITIFNPENEVVIFSATPSVEYNVLMQELWKHDITFNPELYQSGSFVWWDDNHQSEDFAFKIKQIKETNHNFSLGFNLYKHIQEFKLVYSFATRNHEDNLRSYYTKIIDKLFLLGDYGYKLIRDLYVNYSLNHTPPYIISTNIEDKKPYLKLIVDNVV